MVRHAAGCSVSLRDGVQSQLCRRPAASWQVRVSAADVAVSPQALACIPQGMIRA